MQNPYIAIAIDGPAGAGKSTICRQIAHELGYIYVDTGALYRVIGLVVLEAGGSPEDKAFVLSLLRDLSVSIRHLDGEQHVFAGERDVTRLIRTPEVSMAASAVSAFPEVRAFLLELQRAFSRRHHVVMDGRDIGTVVLPDAQIKIFLTATPEDRAQRRCHQMEGQGMAANYDEVLVDVVRRDQNDSGRKTAPLRPASDAVLVDTSGCTREEGYRKVMTVVKEKLGHAI